MKRAMIAIAAIVLILGTFIQLPISDNARASGWYDSPHYTDMPSAYDGNFTRPIGSTPTTIDYGPKVWLDGLTWIDLYSRYGSSVNVTTGNFNNPSYPAGSYLVNGYSIFENKSLQNGNQAPNNATIVNVWLFSMWSSVMNQPWIPLLNMKMTYKIGSWYADREPIKIATINPVFTCIGVNVTADRSWTASLLKSPTLQVRLTMNLPANVPYYLDYLGLYYQWYFNLPGTPGFNPQTSVYPGNFSIPSVIGLFGIVGFIGMIGAPAFGIWMAKTSDQELLPLFLKIALVFVFCFGIFYASIS